MSGYQRLASEMPKEQYLQYFNIPKPIKMFMTTARMVFVNEKCCNEAFKSFDIPFALMTDEKFK